MNFTTLKNKLLELINFDGNFFEECELYNKIANYILCDYVEKNFTKEEQKELSELCYIYFHKDNYVYNE